MATETERLIFLLEANTKKFEKALLSAERIADRRMAAMEKRAITMESRLTASFAKGGAGVTKALSNIAVVAVLAKTGNELIKLADAYTSLQNQTKIYTNTEAEAAQATQFLIDKASEARIKLEDMTAVFAGASRAGRDFGASAAEIQSLTEVVGKAGALANSGPAALSGALRQLSQALPAARVEAEEFNSVIDGAYGIAQAAANGIDEAGGSVSKLQRLVRDGGVSGSQLFRALLSQLPAIQAQFENLTPTIEGSFETLRTRIIEAIGGADDMAQATENISKFILGAAENVEVFGDVVRIAFGELVGIAKVAVPVGAAAGAFVLLNNAIKAYQGLAAAVAVRNIAVALSAGTATGATTVFAVAMTNLARASLAWALTPLGAALIAVGVALAFVTARTLEQVKAEQEAEAQSQNWASAVDKYKASAVAAANASKAGAKAAREAAEADRVAAEAAVAAARANLEKARAVTQAAVANLAAARAETRTVTVASTRSGATKLQLSNTPADRLKALQDIQAATVAQFKAEAEFNKLEAGLKAAKEAATSGGVKAVGVPAKEKKGKKGSSEDAAARRAEREALKKERNDYEAITRALQDQLELKKAQGLVDIELEGLIAARNRALQEASKGAPTKAQMAEAAAFQAKITAAELASQERARAGLEAEIKIEEDLIDRNYERAAALQYQQDIIKATEEYLALGYAREKATELAHAKVQRLTVARQQAAKEDVLRDQEKLTIQNLELQGLYDIAQAEKDRIELRDLIEEYSKNEVKNAREIAKLTQDQIKANQEIEKQRAREDSYVDREIELLKLRGRDREAEKLERKQRAETDARRLAETQGISIDAARQQTGKEVEQDYWAKVEGEAYTTFKDAFREAAKSGDWQEVLRTKLEEVFNKSIDRLFDVLYDVLFSKDSSGGSTAGGIVKSLFGSITGKRDTGGGVSKGRAVLVGERRPEVFVPGVSGAIAANRAIGVGGNGGGRTTIIVNAKDALLTSQLRSDMVQAVAVGYKLQQESSSSQAKKQERYRV